MNESFRFKIAGICGEVKIANSHSHAFLKSKLADHISVDKKTDFRIQVDKKCLNLPNCFNPFLSFQDGNFQVLSDKHSKTKLGVIDLKKMSCRLSDIEDKSQLFHAVLLCSALFLENSGCTILHSSAAFQNGNGYLFPGPANAGKSTILKQLKDFTPLAEEWVAVNKEKGSFSMWSIPHQNSLNARKKVQKILFPKKAKTIGSTRLPPREAAKRLLANCLFSTMHPDFVRGTLERIVGLAEGIPCYQLEFPLDVWLDAEIEESPSLDAKARKQERWNFPSGPDRSGLHESLILTWQCNLLCHHCRPYLPQEEDLPLGDICSYLDALEKKGILFLHLTGGEPLIHKDFWKIASHASRKNFALVLHTNGTLITPEQSEKLKELNFVQVSLTVLGETSQTHDSITGVKGSFGKTLQALKIMKNKGLDVVLTTTQLNENASEIPGMKRLARENDVDLKIIPYQPPDKKEFEEFSRCYHRSFQKS